MRSIRVFTILIIVLLFGVIYTARIRYVSRNPVGAVDTVSINTADYYPQFLPYISPDVEPLPMELPNMTLDPTRFSELYATGFHNEYLPLNARLYMIQLKSNAMWSEISDTQPLTLFAQNVYIIQVFPDELEQIVKKSGVNFAGHYHPHYKLHPDVLSAYYNLTITPDTVLRLSLLYNSDSNEVRSMFNDTNGVVFGSDDHGLYALVKGIDNRLRLFTYALNPAVGEVQIAHQ